jgi:hypothetical protein
MNNLLSHYKAPWQLYGYVHAIAASIIKRMWKRTPYVGHFDFAKASISCWSFWLHEDCYQHRWWNNSLDAWLLSQNCKCVTIRNLWDIIYRLSLNRWFHEVESYSVVTVKFTKWITNNCEKQSESPKLWALNSHYGYHGKTTGMNSQYLTKKYGNSQVRKITSFGEEKSQDLT